MKIKIALIPSEHTCKAQDLSTKLQNAMEAGEMGAVDQLTEELISLTESEYSLSLSEEHWHKLLEPVSASSYSFPSSSLLFPPPLSPLLSSFFAASFSSFSFFFSQSLPSDGVVLQLPFEEEDADV